VLTKQKIDESGFVKLPSVREELVDLRRFHVVDTAQTSERYSIGLRPALCRSNQRRVYRERLSTCVRTGTSGTSSRRHTEACACREEGGCSIPLFHLAPERNGTENYPVNQIAALARLLTRASQMQRLNLTCTNPRHR